MRVFEPIDPESEGLAKSIVDAAFKVHRALGPGPLESVYELCLAHELDVAEYLSNRRSSCLLLTKD